MNPFDRNPERSAGVRWTRRDFLKGCGVIPLAGAGLMSLTVGRASAQANEVLPKHVTPEMLKAVTKGLDYLSTHQSDDGSWIIGGGQAYPVAMTGLAGTSLLANGNSPTRVFSVRPRIPR